MKQRKVLFGWLVCCLVGFGVVGAIQTSFLPESNPDYSNQVADNLVFMSLFAGFFLFLLGLGVLLGYGGRWAFYRGMYPISRWEVVRQASLAAIGLTALLALRGYNVFTWWDAVLLVVALLLVEFSFRVKKVNA